MNSNNELFVYDTIKPYLILATSFNSQINKTIVDSKEDENKLLRLISCRDLILDQMLGCLDINQTGLRVLPREAILIKGLINTSKIDSLEELKKLMNNE